MYCQCLYLDVRCIKILCILCKCLINMNANGELRNTVVSYPRLSTFFTLPIANPFSVFLLAYLHLSGTWTFIRIYINKHITKLRFAVTFSFWCVCFFRLTRFNNARHSTYPYFLRCIFRQSPCTN
ncbi:hypothetical protein V1515DRAFT_597635 [Lipomyces mesembrius]